jgi:hypothetical protein
MRSSGKSLGAIAKYLETQNVPTKNGGKWFGRTVLQIVCWHEKNQNVKK